MRHNIEAMTKCLSMFPDQRFSFDIHAMYFKKTAGLENGPCRSEAAEEFRDAFDNAAVGRDDGTELLWLWVPWVD